MSLSTAPDCELKPASTLPEQPGVLVVRKHHFLVRWSHWLNVPILLGLILSGISIYWADANGDVGALAFLTNSAQRGKLRSVAELASGTTPV